jgi:hypothetical protein
MAASSKLVDLHGQDRTAYFPQLSTCISPPTPLPCFSAENVALVRHATAESILEKLSRLHQTISGIGHSLVVQKVKAEGHVVSPLVPVPVLRDAQSVQGLQHHRTAHPCKPGDLSGREVPN